MHPGGRIACGMGYSDIEQKTHRVEIKADPHSCPGKCRQESCGKIALNIHHDIVTFLSDPCEQPEFIAEFLIAFIPYQNFADVRMSLQQRFIPFSEQKVNLCIRIVEPEFFDQSCCQNDISDESGLNDQEGFLHGAKLGEKQGFGRRLPCRCRALI